MNKKLQQCDRDFALFDILGYDEDDLQELDRLCRSLDGECERCDWKYICPFDDQYLRTVIQETFR